jgi:hypothetical protein
MAYSYEQNVSFIIYNKSCIYRHHRLEINSNLNKTYFKYFSTSFCLFDTYDCIIFCNRGQRFIELIEKKIVSDTSILLLCRIC